MDDSRRSTAPPKEPSGRVCTVCSDRANGYNFGVLTCESCKAFFRRNAAKHHEIKCPFSNSCQITSASRKFCQACRLNKCFSVGMNSDWLNEVKPKNGGKFKRKKPDIVTHQIHMKVEVNEDEEDVGEEEGEDEKVSVPKALFEKLIRKASIPQKDQCTCTCQCGFYPSSQRLTAFDPKENIAVQQESHLPHQPIHTHSDTFYSSSSATHSPASIICSTPSSLADSSNYGTPQHTSQHQSPSNYKPSSFQMNRNFSELSPQSSQSSVQGQYTPLMSPFQLGTMQIGGNSLPMSSFPPIPDRSWTPNSIDYIPMIPLEPHELLTKIHNKIDKYVQVLDEQEMKMLEELHVQNEPLNAPLSKWYNPTNIDGVFKIIEEALRRIVNMICQLTAFRELHVEDRKNLLKTGFCELLIVRGLMAFNKEGQSWSHSFGLAGKMEVKIDVLKNPETREHYEAHKQLLDTFGDDVRNNEHLMLIFNAIVIFHGKLESLRNRKQVNDAQAKYFGMLNKILIFEYGQKRADLAYKKLLNQVVDLHRVNRSMLHIFYGLDIAQLDPLIRELLCTFA